MLSRYPKYLLQKIKVLRAPAIEKILATSLITQITILVLSVIRIPISLHFFGVNEYATLLMLLTYWQIMVIFGDSARKAWRMDRSWVGSSPKVTFHRTTLVGYLSIASVASSFFLWLFEMSGFLLSGIVTMAGLIHLKYSPFSGLLELNGLYGKVNWFLLNSNVLFFIPWYLSCQIGNEYLYLITVCGAYPMSSYLCRQSCRRNLKDLGLKVSQTQHREMNFGKYLSLSFVSKSSYLIDPFMIQGQLGAVQVVTHSIYQRFLNLYSFTPSALSPLFMVESTRMHVVNLSRHAQKYLVLITVLTTVILFAFSEKIFSILSSGEISSNVYLVMLVLLQGIIGSTITRVVQSSNSLNQLALRIKIGAIGTIISAIATFLLLPFLGISISFITSILYSLAMYFYLRNRA